MNNNKCTTMKRRTLTMDWDALGDFNDDDDQFFESRDRLSTAVPLDLAFASESDDNDDFEDSRMSFASAISSTSFKKGVHHLDSVGRSSNIMEGYDMWMSEPGDIHERRKRLLQGMGLSSNKDLLSIASTKIVRAISRKSEIVRVPTKKIDSSPTDESKVNESEPEDSPSTPILLVRSRSDGDIDPFSVKTKQRKEELLDNISKQKLTRTSSGQLVSTTGVCNYSSTVVRMSAERAKNRPPTPNSDLMQSVMADGAFGSFFLIKNLDTGNEFIVKEYNDQGMWNKLSDVQTGKQLTMEEFEKSVGYSPVVKELMRRANVSKNTPDDGRKPNQNSLLTKSFRNSKRKGAAFLKNIKGVIMAEKEQEHSSVEASQRIASQRVASQRIASQRIASASQREKEKDKDKDKAPNNSSEWVKARQQGKSYKEFTAVHLSQEIQAHEGSIWTIKFSWDARYLASAGEDKMIHVWEVQECDILSAKPGDDASSGGGTPLHPMAGSFSDRPPLAEITPLPSEKKKKGKNNKKKGNPIPDYVSVPETVFGLSEKPVCTFKGHQEDILDLSWSRSQLLLSSSMDKTVRLWDLETKTCLKTFAHNDYVTCIQFNPVDDDYFISGSLDAKVRIWNIPDRQVVDWTDIHEMVTATSYTPDGQGVIIGSHQGSCHMYMIEDSKLEHQTDIMTKKKPPAPILPGFQSPAKNQTQTEKITGLQFAPSSSSDVLITSGNSRVHIYNGTDLVQKFKGFRNSSSQISASFSPDGKHVISASEDSQVYIWKVEESKPQPNGKVANKKITTQSNEHFHCKDVTAAISWPGSTRIEPPIVEIQSKRHSKRSNAPLPTSAGSSPTRDETTAGSRRLLPPLPKKNNNNSSSSSSSNNNNGGLDRTVSCSDDDLGNSSRIDPGIGVSDSFGASSPSISYGGESPNISSASVNSGGSQSWSSSWSLFDNGSTNGGQTIQATAWGLVIVTASLEGEIKVYQNFGLPVKVGRQPLF